MTEPEYDEKTSPAANQIDVDPVPSAPEESPQASGDVSPPRPIKSGADEDLARTAPGGGALEAAGVAAPGSSLGDGRNTPAPAILAASDADASTDGSTAVHATAIAAPGKPDGEVDTRR